MRLSVTYNDEGKFFFCKNDENVIEIPKFIN